MPLPASFKKFFLKGALPMIVTLDLGQILTLGASICGVVTGVVAIARFLKWWWHKPLDPAE